MGSTDDAPLVLKQASLAKARARRVSHPRRGSLGLSSPAATPTHNGRRAASACAHPPCVPLCGQLGPVATVASEVADDLRSAIATTSKEAKVGQTTSQREKGCVVQ